MSMRRLIAMVAALAIGSCSDPIAPESDLLRINVLPDALEIVNISQQPVYLFIAERNTLALLTWAPCTDPTTCEGIDVGKSMVVTYDAITGYFPGAAEAVVHHWLLIPNGASGFQPDSIRATIVPLAR